MKRRQLLRHLRGHGCELLREGGNHSWWHNPAQNRRSAIPRHTEISNILATRSRPLDAESRMDATPQILVEPGNPFGFDPNEFAELIEGISEELGREYDVRTAYREQVGAAVTLYEVVEFWLSWQSWSAAAQGALGAKLLDKALEWHRKRREANPDTTSRPVWIRVIVKRGDWEILREVRVGESSGEVEYGPFADALESSRDLEKGPPPLRAWPPAQEDLPQRQGRELADRRTMLEVIHAMVMEAQRQERELVVLDSSTVVGIGRQMRHNAAESRGLFRRLIEEGYIRLRSPLEDIEATGELRAEVEYLTDRGLEIIGEI